MVKMTPQEFNALFGIPSLLDSTVEIDRERRRIWEEQYAHVALTMENVKHDAEQKTSACNSGRAAGTNDNETATGGTDRSEATGTVDSTDD